MGPPDLRRGPKGRVGLLLGNGLHLAEPVDLKECVKIDESNASLWQRDEALRLWEYPRLQKLYDEQSQKEREREHGMQQRRSAWSDNEAKELREQEEAQRRAEEGRKPRQLLRHQARLYLGHHFALPFYRTFINGVLDQPWVPGEERSVRTLKGSPIFNYVQEKDRDLPAQNGLPDWVVEILSREYSGAGWAVEVWEDHMLFYKRVAR